MATPASDERRAFAATFADLGPEAPTILPGWGAPELLEHLLLRERYPHLMVGPRLPGELGRRAQQARQQLRARTWGDLVDLFRAGPGPLSFAGTVDSLSGEGELLIHHEDLRRAQPGWEPRALPEATQAKAWRALSLLAPVAVRVPADVTLVAPHGGRRLRSRRPAGSVRVHGDPLELLLWVSGRDEVAQVRIDGDDGGVQALEEGRRGL
ncbi:MULTISPECIES: TIGR03085 family metal-binding protein [unclassified Brachybacterium]|uniref:TIGR03085 family metal-binding protein n=1 Tax=unclassified Brachybacterium TaxID=2623841 RepID=UPI00360879C9